MRLTRGLFVVRGMIGSCILNTNQHLLSATHNFLNCHFFTALTSVGWQEVNGHISPMSKCSLGDLCGTSLTWSISEK